MDFWNGVGLRHIRCPLCPVTPFAFATGHIVTQEPRQLLFIFEMVFTELDNGFGIVIQVLQGFGRSERKIIFLVAEEYIALLFDPFPFKDCDS